MMVDNPASKVAVMETQQPSQRRGALRLILGGASHAAEEPVSIADTQAETTSRELRAEAVALEAWYGPNAYSQYLAKHGRRPDPADAATIGRIIGAQVKASDGTMQPRLTKAQREVIRADRKRRNADSSRAQKTEQFTHAMMILSDNREEADEIIAHANSQLDESNFGSLVLGVLTFANRITEGFTRGKTHRAQKPT
jgi:hypothetical protein